MRLFLLACLLMSSWGMAQTSGQQPSLADLSKEARERKAKTTKPAQVITNADMKRYQNAPVSMSKSRPSDFEPKEPAEGEAAAGEKPTADQQKLLDAAEQALRSAALDYKNAVNAALVYQLKMNSLNNAYYAEQQETMRSVYEEQLARTAKDIEANKTEITRTSQALDQAKQDARQAGMTDEQIDKVVGEIPNPPSVDSLLPSNNSDSLEAPTVQDKDMKPAPES